MTLIWRNWKKNLRHSSRYRKKRKADQAMAFLEEDMKDKLIEKVVVYPGNRIEIVWKFEGHF
jgi:uncharacterized cupredoxin-like copper-binding protein